ncbi:MAG: hypothetical protein JRI36_09880 [Deltaproteobacteria bacterium]|nr:hypothetical protein [Deltaproteobacteria bacterium]
MSDKERFIKFFEEFGIEASVVNPEEVILEMDDTVDWMSALSVGQAWFLFGKDENYLGLLNDETMEFEPRKP